MKKNQENQEKQINRRELLLALSAGTLLLSGCGGGTSFPSVPYRKDLLLGPYGIWEETQLPETKEWTNLFWEMFRLGAGDESKIQYAIQHMQYMQVSTVLDLDEFLYTGKVESRSIDPNAEQRVRAVFQRMQSAGVLSKVVMLVPRDEPNLYPGGLDTLPAATGIIRKVMGEFPELSSALLGSSFTTIRPWGYLELFDVVGCDEYDSKEEILASNGAVNKLRKDCKNNQKIMLFPGASYGQSIIPFVNYANATPDIWGIVYFLHRLNPAEGIIPALPDQPQLFLEYQTEGKKILQASSS